MEKGGRRCQYFKEEEQHEKGHRGIKGNNLFVGLMIPFSGWRTAPLGGGWWEMRLERSMGMTREEPCRAFLSNLYFMPEKILRDFEAFNLKRFLKTVVLIR